MDAINDVAHLLNRSIDGVRDYVKENGIAIGILLTVVYYLRSRYPIGRLSRGNLLLNTGKTENCHQEEMRRVRQRQQEIADKRAKEAHKEQSEKEAKEKDRRNHVAKDRKPEDGIRLGNGSNSNGRPRTIGRNPMQPWTSNTPSYRPARRNPRGGG